MPLRAVETHSDSDLVFFTSPIQTSVPSLMGPRRALAMRTPVSTKPALSQSIPRQQVKKEKSIMGFLVTWPSTQQESTVLHREGGTSDLQISS